MTCKNCKLWAKVSRKLHPHGFCGTFPIPTDNSGLCVYEIEMGIMHSRPKWLQGDCHFADNCPAFIRKGSKR